MARDDLGGQVGAGWVGNGLSRAGQARIVGGGRGWQGRSRAVGEERAGMVGRVGGGWLGRGRNDLSLRKGLVCVAVQIQASDAIIPSAD